MNKTRLMLIVAFIATFAAGSAVALVARPAAPRITPQPQTQQHTPAERDRSRRSPFDQLNLSDEQRTQIRDIWENSRNESRDLERQMREQVRRQRDEAIQQLLGESLYAQYEQIQTEYREGMDKINQHRRETFQAAQEQTMQVLTDEQREKWEQMLKERAQRMENRPERPNHPDANRRTRERVRERGSSQPDNSPPSSEQPNTPE